jgi:hypothetical protein
VPVTAQPPDAPSILDLAVSALVVKLTRAFYYAAHQIPAQKRERGGVAGVHARQLADCCATDKRRKQIAAKIAAKPHRTGQITIELDSKKTRAPWSIWSILLFAVCARAVNVKDAQRSATGCEGAGHLALTIHTAQRGASPN